MFKKIIISIIENPKEGLFLILLLLGTFLSIIFGALFWGCKEGYDVFKIKAERKVNDLSGYWKRYGSTYAERLRRYLNTRSA